MLNPLIYIFIFCLAFPFTNILYSGENPQNKITICVSIQPQAFFAERIGGNHVQVHTLIPAGRDPHLFEPDPQQIVTLASSRLFFKIGIPFEKYFLNKITAFNKTIDVIDCTRGITLRKIKDEHYHQPHPDSLSGEKEEVQHHQDADLHIWLGVNQIKTIAANITEALVKTDPDNAADYRKNHADFLKDLDAVNTDITRILAPYKGRKIFVFHPAFGYFAETYGLVQEPIELEGKSPSPKQIGQIITKARHDNVKVIFIQSQFDSKSAQTIAKAIGGSVVSMDPLARDVLKNLVDMALSIEKAFTNYGL